jgi:hypothetical protein
VPRELGDAQLHPAEMELVRHAADAPVWRSEALAALVMPTRSRASSSPAATGRATGPRGSVRRRGARTRRVARLPQAAERGTIVWLRTTTHRQLRHIRRRARKRAVVRCWLSRWCERRNPSRFRHLLTDGGGFRMSGGVFGKASAYAGVTIRPSPVSTLAQQARRCGRACFFARLQIGLVVLIWRGCPRHREPAYPSLSRRQAVPRWSSGAPAGGSPGLRR